ncbi:MAG: SIMPL domain-containing protein [Telluria sp.]
MSFRKIVLILSLATAMSASAQTGPSTSGTTVIVPATGEVTHANDEATITFSVEEHDKDKAAAASRVNRKMKEGMDILRAADPGAQLKTQGYYTYPVYPEQPPQPLAGVSRPPVPVGWRVGQSVQMKTKNLPALPKTVAAAQKVLALNGLSFGLSRETLKRVDDQRIAEAYKNLNERIAATASAMGRKPSDAVIDTLDIDGAGGIRPPMPEGMVMNYASRAAKAPEDVSEPSFEPGETTLQMRIVGKVKFK